MIAVKLMGGLGNQMFQYAIAKKIAHSRKTKPVLDMAFFENIAESDTPREYEMDCFNIVENILPASRRPNENDSHYLGTKGKFRIAKDTLRRKKWNIYREVGHGFDSKVLEVSDNTYLIGFWQTEDYFKDIRSILLKDFTIKTPPKGKNKEILEQIISSNSISIHVRRGDYISNANANQFHGTKDKNYYETALTKMAQKGIKDPTLFVFSDDPEWCKKNLKFAFKTTYVEGNKKGFEDMRLMMHCKHNIIANSSFSWWAAWLNTNTEKIIVAPRIWFSDKKTNKETDVVPKSWIRI